MHTTKVVHGIVPRTHAPSCCTLCSCLQGACEMVVHCCTTTYLATQDHRFLPLPPFHACQCCPEGAAMSSGSSDLRGHVRCRGFEVKAMVRGLSAMLFRKRNQVRHLYVRKCQGDGPIFLFFLAQVRNHCSRLVTSQHIAPKHLSVAASLLAYQPQTVQLIMRARQEPKPAVCHDHDSPAFQVLHVKWISCT